MEYHIDPKCLEVGTRISSGSFGAVHSGRLLEPSTGQWNEVAVKRMLPRARTDPREHTRFAKEAMFTAGLSKRCKHVLQVHGWSETDDGQLCLVMRKYGRGTLQELLYECERLPPQHVLRVSLDMASGVAELHAQNMVYNDLKPDNCLVEADGGIVLADFGVLKPLSNSNRAPTSTITQYGSPLFMAPEKLASWPGARQAATFAADVWALAVSILQVATNDPTLPYSSGFDMEDMDKMLNIDKELPEVPQLSELPGLQQLLQRCLALDPDARPSAAEVREALEDISCQVVDRDDEGKPTIRLTTGKLADLQDALGSNSDTASGCVIDLCGYTFSGAIVGALTFPSRTTLCLGTLELPSTCHVSITTHNVKLKDLVVKGAEEQRFTVEVSKAGSLHMADCHVAGGNKDGGAVGVLGAHQGLRDSSSLMAKNCSMCSASGSGVFVTDGARAALEECKCNGSSGNGLETKGTGSTATATACSFSNNKCTNVTAQEGATVVLQDGCKCNESESCGLWVAGKGSTATATACSFSNKCTNVIAQEGATVVLQDGCACNDSKEEKGLVVTDKGSTATATACSFSNNKRTNVTAQEGATVVLQDGCKCNESESCGLWVTGKGSTATATACSFSNNKRTNVIAQEGATVVLQDGCACNDSKEERGLMVTDKGSTATATASSFSNNKRTNVTAQEGATVVLQDGCKCNESESCGLNVADKGSTATASACSFSSNNLDNVRVCKGAAAMLLDGCACNDSKKECGLMVTDKGSTAIASACSFCSNDESNVLAQEGASVLLQDSCQCNGSKEGSGWRAHGQGSVVIVRDSSASGNKFGSDAEQRGMVLFL